MRAYWHGLWEAAEAEDVGALVVRLDSLTDEQLDAVLEAAQLIDREAQDEFERRLCARDWRRRAIAKGHVPPLPPRSMGS